MKMTLKIQKAREYAERLHSGQERKGDDSPYIVHPFAVAEILSNFTDDEDIIAAGYLHDVLEDVPGYGYEELKNDFGEIVAGIVWEVSEKKNPEDSEEKLKESWLLRKKLYIEHIEFSGYGAKMVCAADKLHNLLSLRAAYKKYGEALWLRFHADRAKSLWFYEEVTKILLTKLDNELALLVKQSYDELKNVF